MTNTKTVAEFQGRHIVADGTGVRIVQIPMVRASWRYCETLGDAKADIARGVVR